MTAFVITIIFYAFGMSITLGPTNIIMMSTGANYGFKNTIPFATGAAFGFTILVVIVALGFGELLTKHIVIMQTMTYIGSIMICFMGEKDISTKFLLRCSSSIFKSKIMDCLYGRS